MKKVKAVKEKVKKEKVKKEKVKFLKSFRVNAQLQLKRKCTDLGVSKDYPRYLGQTLAKKSIVTVKAVKPDRQIILVEDKTGKKMIDVTYDDVKLTKNQPFITGKPTILWDPRTRQPRPTRRHQVEVLPKGFIMKEKVVRVNIRELEEGKVYVVKVLKVCDTKKEDPIKLLGVKKPLKEKICRNKTSFNSYMNALKEQFPADQYSIYERFV